MAKTFVEYEKSHNLFLQAMRGTALTAALRRVASPHWAVLVPQSVRLEEIGLGTISESFLRTHTVIFEAPPQQRGSDPAPFVTLDGLKGRLLTTAAGAPGSDAGRPCDAVEIDQPAEPAGRQSLQVLRRAEVEVDPSDGFSVQVYLVHDVVRAGWCAHSSTVAGDPLLGGGDFLWTEPQQRRRQGAPEPPTPPPPAAPQQLQPVAAAGVQPAPVTPARQARPQFRFKDFAEKMRRPEAGLVKKKLQRFVAEVLRSPASDDRLPERIRAFLSSAFEELKQCPVWQGASEQELDFAQEGLEKYIMTKVFDRTFGLPEERKRDDALAKRLRSLGFIEPSHLEVPPRCVEHPKWAEAQQELLKLNRYKNPRDKLICISNACKLIFQVLHQLDPDKAMSADDFLPCLILLVGKTNPPNLYSNCEFIQKYRNEGKMSSESGYYFCTLQSVIYFWETADASSLHIDQALFDRIDAEIEGRGVEKPDFSQIDDEVTGHDGDEPEAGGAGRSSPQESTGLSTTAPPTPGGGGELQRQASRSPPQRPTGARPAAGSVAAAAQAAAVVPTASFAMFLPQASAESAVGPQGAGEAAVGAARAALAASAAQRAPEVAALRRAAEQGQLRVSDLPLLHREWQRLAALAQAVRQAVGEAPPPGGGG